MAYIVCVILTTRSTRKQDHCVPEPHLSSLLGIQHQPTSPVNALHDYSTYIWLPSPLVLGNFHIVCNCFYNFVIFSSPPPGMPTGPPPPFPEPCMTSLPPSTYHMASASRWRRSLNTYLGLPVNTSPECKGANALCNRPTQWEQFQEINSTPYLPLRISWAVLVS